jgi:hypothetical protein
VFEWIKKGIFPSVAKQIKGNLISKQQPYLHKAVFGIKHMADGL